MLVWFCITTMLHSSQRLVMFAIYFWVSISLLTVSIRNIRLLTFGFVTTILHDILNKSRYQNNINQPIYFRVDHWVWLSWKMWNYDNLVNTGLSQGNSSTELFWLTNFWVNIQFPALHKKLVKTNKNQSIIYQKANLIFQGKLQWILVIPNFLIPKERRRTATTE